MMKQLQASLHAIVAAEFEEGETFGFAALFVGAVADRERLHAGEVRAYAGGGGAEWEVAC